MKDLDLKREIYLKRLEDPFVTLGILIPSKVVHRGREIRLREEIASLRREALEGAEGWRGRAVKLLKLLKEMEERAVKRIEAAEDEEGLEEAFREALGPLRAAQEVTALLEGEVYEEAEEEDVEDLKRWMEYIRKLK
ncbi:MAG: hypothetical protein J7K08_06945 [Thermoplasmata archaeon]|nr:hypothetical protein [Thermoplasmata archaeon]OYT48379.1 MAG: hypothetical protein B6U83_03605 [Thermoplasmatales archaeon ex4484_36]HDD60517.1 hypothetical protein [Euryarchaeota archaeon]RLF54659.1 MAG: hypothetical protein DRN28_04835 [Thermoplasmata archaeon]RLF71523.1 MAG: hypothetical protein DRN40_02315 [Thermoplasmata archaeon]